MAFDYGCGGTYGGDDGADEEEEPEDELAEDLVEEAVVPVGLLGLVREEGEPAVIPCSAHATSCEGERRRRTRWGSRGGRRWTRRGARR